MTLPIESVVRSSTNSRSMFLMKATIQNVRQHKPALFGVHSRSFSSGYRMATQRSTVNATMNQLDAFTIVVYTWLDTQIC